MAALGEDLLGIVNKLQDLVFNTIGSDSLDLPQIVCSLLCSSWPHILTDSRLLLALNQRASPLF